MFSECVRCLVSSMCIWYPCIHIPTYVCRKRERERERQCETCLYKDNQACKCRSYVSMPTFITALAYAYAHVYMHTHVYTQTYICIYIYIHICTFAYTCMHAHVYVQVYIHNIHTKLCSYVFNHMMICVCVHLPRPESSFWLNFL